MSITIGNSGCVSKAVFSGLQARRKKDTAEYITHEGRLYEYRSDTQIFRHDATKLVRIKKAKWLAIRAQHEEEKMTSKQWEQIEAQLPAGARITKTYTAFENGETRIVCPPSRRSI